MASKTAADKTATADKTAKGTDAPETSSASTAAVESKPQVAQKDVDALVDTLMNQEVTDAAVYKLDQRINSAMEELARLKAARARLTGKVADESDDDEEEEATAAPQRRTRQPRKQATGEGGNGRPDHGAAILKAIGSGELTKAQIAEKLTAMGHEMNPAILSTYLGNMKEAGILKQKMITPRRASYKKATK